MAAKRAQPKVSKLLPGPLAPQTIRMQFSSIMCYGFNGSQKGATPSFKFIYKKKVTCPGPLVPKYLKKIKLAQKCLSEKSGH